MHWLILLLTLPPTPSRHRVGIWRKLKGAGAVVLKGSAWMLPDLPETRERMHWLMQEVTSLKGDAALLRTDAVETLPQRDPALWFHEARAADYAAVRQGCEALLAELRRPDARRPAAAAARSRLVRLKRELDAVARIDYLQAPAGEAARRAYAAVAAKLETQETAMKPRKTRPAPRGLPPAGSTWVTRPRPHIDRIASAWLITRFHDPKARFAFAEKPAEMKRAVPFDTLGVEFGHQGEDCTFETLMKRLALKDRRVARIAELVHEADLRDGKFPGDEAAGLDLSIKGLAAAIGDDQALLKAGMTLFDGLYATLGTRASRKG